MANETQITLVGNLTADPELRFTQSGTPVANFTIASTPSSFDRQTNDWKDGEPLFIRCTAWKALAENVAASLSKGAHTIVHGNLRSRTFTTKEGDQRTVMELDAQEVGMSLRFVTATAQRPGQQNQRQGSTWGQQAQGGNRGWQYGDGAQQEQAGGWGQNPNPQTTAQPWNTTQNAQDGQQPPF